MKTAKNKQNKQNKQSNQNKQNKQNKRNKRNKWNKRNRNNRCLHLHIIFHQPLVFLTRKNLGEMIHYLHLINIRQIFQQESLQPQYQKVHLRPLQVVTVVINIMETKMILLKTIISHYYYIIINHF